MIGSIRSHVKSLRRIHMGGDNAVLPTIKACPA